MLEKIELMTQRAQMAERVDLPGELVLEITKSYLEMLKILQALICQSGTTHTGSELVIARDNAIDFINNINKQITDRESR